MYMFLIALEVLLKKPIDYTIDFYLLGVLLYEIMINKVKCTVLLL